MVEERANWRWFSLTRHNTCYRTLDQEVHWIAMMEVQLDRLILLPQYAQHENCLSNGCGFPVYGCLFRAGRDQGDKGRDFVIRRPTAGHCWRRPHCAQDR